MQGLMYLCLEKEDKPQGNYTHPHPQKNIMHDLDKQINQRLEDLAKKENLRHLSLPYPSLGKWIVVNKEKRLNLSGNDYLGLTERDDLREQFAALHPGYSTPSGSTSSRLLLGNYEEAALFEAEIAQAIEHPAALLFNSGYHLNTGILPALAHLEGVKVYADRMVHASIIDGIRLSRLPFTRFRHNDLEHLTELLKEDEGKYRISIVAVESLYSMDGDEADLEALVALKKKYPSLVIYCDEAHAIGTHGANGYGLAEEQGVLADIDILVGTFGKALNSMGAYAAVSTPLREYLINMARPLIFSTMLPPAVIAWSRYIFALLPQLGEERAQLRQVSQYLRSSLQKKGYSCPGVAQILPLIIGENGACGLLAKRLQKGGFEVKPIRYPTVALGTARLRLSLTAAITSADLDPMLQMLEPLR